MEQAEVKELIEKFSAAFERGKEQGLLMAWMIADVERSALLRARIENPNCVDEIVSAVEHDPEVASAFEGAVSHFKETHEPGTPVFLHLVLG